MQTKNVDWLRSEIDALPDVPNEKTLIDVVEENRVMPPNSPFPGAFRYDRTPYMIEPALEASPTSDTRQITGMKGGQLGFSVGTTEALVLFSTNVGLPNNLLMMTATKNLMKEVVHDRIEPMFDTSGVKCVSQEVQSPGSGRRATGDTTFEKYGAGWRHSYKSFGNIREVRSTTYGVVILEEIEEMGDVESRHRQGAFIDVIKVRMRAMANRSKLLVISTPLIAETSIVHKEFLKGDQRYYYIPCPHCGHMQRLEFKHLKYKTEGDIAKRVLPESVYYECQSGKQCKIRNEEKSIFLRKEKCEWRPHNAEHAEQGHKSYHISALYCPPGMSTWYDICQDWVNAQGDEMRLQSFFNMTLGLPRQLMTAPEPNTLHVLKGNYPAYTVPFSEKDGSKPLLYTMGVDVQGDRLEAELVGHGEGYKTWSVGYYVFEGDTDNHMAGAWSAFRAWYNSDSVPALPCLIFIDSGYNTEVVYNFCSGYKVFKPVKGVDTDYANAYVPRTLKGYVDGNLEPLKRYDLHVTLYKSRIYRNLALRQDDVSGVLPNGFMRFPSDYPASYFEKLTAERVIVEKKGSHYKHTFDAGGRRNEPLDCRVYALAALDVYAYYVCVDLGLESTDWHLFWHHIKKVLDEK